MTQTRDRHVSETPATQWLKRHAVPYIGHAYDYVDHGGSAEAARQLGLEPARVAKTLIMEDEKAKPLVVIMRGDCDVSTKQLARQIGVKSVVPCRPEVAQRHSGYQVGGTSPFGLRKAMPVWFERDLLAHETLYINGGRRGYLVEIAPAVLVDVLGAQAVEVALDKSTGVSHR